MTDGGHHHHHQYRVASHVRILALAGNKGQRTGRLDKGGREKHASNHEFTLSYSACAFRKVVLAVGVSRFEVVGFVTGREGGSVVETPRATSQIFRNSWKDSFPSRFVSNLRGRGGGGGVGTPRNTQRGQRTDGKHLAGSDFGSGRRKLCHQRCVQQHQKAMMRATSRNQPAPRRSQNHHDFDPSHRTRSARRLCAMRKQRGLAQQLGRAQVVW